MRFAELATKRMQQHVTRRQDSGMTFGVNSRAGLPSMLCDSLPCVRFMLCRMDESLMHALSEGFRCFDYPPASALYTYGSVCDELYVVLSGQVGAGLRERHYLQALVRSASCR